MRTSAEYFVDDPPPDDALYLSEFARSAFDYLLLTYSGPLLAALPRGDRHSVLVLPALHTTDASTQILRTVLKFLGYRTYGWRLGLNVGPTSKAVHGMRTRLAYLADRYQRPVSLIGCSLGGIFARRLARQTPELVRQVITLGSPIRLARHSQSRAAPVFHLYAHRHVEPLDLPLEHGAGPLPVPATSIYTPFDGIVAWRTCLDVPSTRAENIGVLGSHFGIAHHPATLWAVADRLAQPAGTWAPFQPPSLLRAAYLTSGS
ncbi:alpha/beta hydrolase [Mycolicibacterium elephantis]|uniref:Alpha/beta hydrolase n=1 Tax=Mycolicibacterium elephantis TaxID=81858 RepID=A0A1A0QFF2_9MYCO|nr:hypothetical protein [Mycolicibacterium elephantis]OBB20179.1 alpha/beta hydrolase [Mycolicibacterium elephantis]OBF00988.1 alpha/beta hydrolase [Mycolicibacterium elephantis]ORA61464.1 alpha/beta hydrolase [Mycolicibacterium elephantis]